MVSATSAPYAPTFCTGVAPRRSWNSRKALQPAEPMGQRGDDDVVPHRTGFGAHDVVLDGDLGVGEQHDGQVGEVVCQHHVGSTGEHEDVVYSPQDRDDLL